MKVIILKTGEVKDVAEGYARNYLLPKKLAAIATDQMLKQAEEKRKKLVEDQDKKKSQEQEVIDKLKDIVISIQVKTNEEGKMFAALNAKEILEAVEKQYQTKLPEKWFQMKDPIKEVGEYTFEIVTNTGIKAKLKVQLNKES